MFLMMALGAGFLLGLWELYELRFNAGDIYPAYSSLRADPLGTKALYESLRHIPGISADRNYLDLPSLPKGPSTILFLGDNPLRFASMAEEQVKQLESLAASGARVVIAMQPVNRLREQKNPEVKSAVGPSPLEKRWRIRFGYITRPAEESEEGDIANPKLSALYFRDGEKVVYRLERPFGTGAVVLIANCYPLSNEALAGDRNIALIAWALGSNHKVIFDEHHLGLAETGGVVTLARKYHLEGLAVMLLVLLALFIWKNSSGLLPPRPVQDAGDDSVAAKDASSGLANLLRRNIPVKALMKTCLDEWEGSRHGGKFYSQAKIEQVRSLARREGDAVDTYRKLSRILSERSDA